MSELIFAHAVPPLIVKGDVLLYFDGTSIIVPREMEIAARCAMDDAAGGIGNRDPERIIRAIIRYYSMANLARCETRIDGHSAATLKYWVNYVPCSMEFFTIDEAIEWAESTINAGRISAESIEIDGKVVMVDNHDGYGLVAPQVTP